MTMCELATPAAKRARIPRDMSPPPLRRQSALTRRCDKFDQAHRSWVFKTLGEKMNRHVPKTIIALFQPEVMDELSIIWSNIDEEEQTKWDSNQVAWMQWLLFNN